MSAPLGPAGRIGSFFIDSKLTPLLVIAALALGGLAVGLTPREEEPQIVVPMIDVFVALPGAAPEEVENRITVPVETRMWDIPGVEYVYSTSMSGVSLVTVRYLVGEDPEESLVKVYDKLASGLDRMPASASPPLVKVRTIDDVPVLALTLWSDSHDSSDLRRVATELRREISRLDDVSEIGILGGQRRQLRVLLDPAAMVASGVDPAALVDALRSQNAAVPAGTYQDANREVVVETGAFLRNREEVASLVVGAHGGRPVYLRDVARILDEPGEPDTHVFFAGGRGGLAPAVTLAIAKRKGADAHRVVGRVMDRVRALRGALIPDTVEVTITRDYGATADEKARELLTHLIGAVVAVTLVIGLALGWRGALVVFVSVPVSFALTLFVYYLFGYTLNRVTLFALIFVTGIVVDDSIIVVENIVRHLSMRDLPPKKSAIRAVSEVGNPTILATLTVIAAVLPMAFVRGLMGPYMRPMPVGASLAMMFSLGVALIVTPWFAYRLIRGSDEVAGGGEPPADPDEAGAGGLEGGYRIEDTRTYRVYRWLMAPLLDSAPRRWLALGAVVLLLLASLALFPLEAVAVKMLPFDNKSELQVIVDMPEGTTLEATSRVAREIALQLQTEPEVTDLQMYVGTHAPINFNGLVRHYDLRSGPNVADLQVNFVHKQEREERSHDIARRVRPPVQAIAARHGAAVKIAEVPPGPPVLATLVAEVYGPTQERRIEVAERIREIFAATDGVVDVDWTVEAPQDKRIFRVDREKAALHGVATAQVARTLRLALAGEDAGVLHDESEAEEVPIRLQLPRPERSSPASLADVRLRSMSGALVPLSELVAVEETAVPVSRMRKNLQPVVYVTADVAGAQESPVYAILALMDPIAGLELPEGVELEQHFRDEPISTEVPVMKWDGEWHITYEVFRDLGAAFAAVLVLIYLLIVGWFGSFVTPLVMMIAIPLALVGVVPGHWLFGAFFTATSMIGFIALAGIMVRNSVLLIDFVDLSLERGRNLRDAVLEAGAVRFRPILLTAGTVVVGAFVILFDPIFEGLAIALMAGAFASTVLTLLVVPLVHYAVQSRMHPELRPRGPDAGGEAEAENVDPGAV